MSSTPSPGLPAGLEAKLWTMADKLRGNVDPAEYKHVVVGLIFLEYISDAFQAKYAAIEATPWAGPEDREEYAAGNAGRGALGGPAGRRQTVRYRRPRG